MSFEFTFILTGKLYITLFLAPVLGRRSLDEGGRLGLGGR